PSRRGSPTSAGAAAGPARTCGRRARPSPGPRLLRSRVPPAQVLGLRYRPETREGPAPVGRGAGPVLGGGSALVAVELHLSARQEAGGAGAGADRLAIHVPVGERDTLVLPLRPCRQDLDRAARAEAGLPARLPLALQRDPVGPEEAADLLDGLSGEVVELLLRLPAGVRVVQVHDDADAGHPVVRGGAVRVLQRD